MKQHLCDPPGVRRVWPLPDTEPVDTSVMTKAVRAHWITDEMVKSLEEQG